MKKSVRQLEKYRQVRLSAEKGGAAPQSAPLRICLVFPNTYHAGMSNLAVHTLYSILNDKNGCMCERSFCEEPLTGRSLESGAGLSTFHIVAFTVSFELDYPNVLKALTEARIPPRSADRDENHPFVIAGGPCIFSNPEPLAECFDFCIIGEGEQAIQEVIDAVAKARERGSRRGSILRALSEIPGVYVPSLFEPIYSDEGMLTAIEEKESNRLPIKACVVPNLDDYPCHSAFVTPKTEFSNMFLVELSRGCRRGCTFCSACHIYLRRERSLESLERQITGGKTLSDRIGLVTSDLADYSRRRELLEFLLNNNLGFSVSSVRADFITEDLLEGMRRTGQQTLTVAPEVASAKLARFTGKRITAETLLNAVNMALEHDIIHFRLYFMIGFPGETDEDVRAISELAARVHARMRLAAGRLRKIGRLTLSVNPFVPKPFTPLESMAFAESKTLSRRVKLLRDGLARIGNTRLIAESPRMARLQCVFARGDRRTMRLAELLAEGRTPAQAMRDFGKQLENITEEQAQSGKVRPWNVIVPPSLGKGFLAKERLN